MRVIVCGGRNVGRALLDAKQQDSRREVQKATLERTYVSSKLSSLHTERGFCHISAGDEGGAERLGLSWAAVNDVPSTLYVRERLRMGRETIDQRNARMLATSNPDLIVAIGGGASTARLLESASRMSIPVVQIDVPTVDPDSARLG